METNYGGKSQGARVGDDAVVPALFAEVVARTPDATAVLSAAQGSLSYRELDLRSNRLARRLLALGVGPDDRVALCLERTPDLIVALLAILKAGGAYLPLEATYPKARMRFMLDDAEPRAILTESALAGALPESAAPVLVLDTESFEGESAAPLELTVGGENLAYVLYTSGSTGTPKGVEVPHRAIERLVRENSYATFGPDRTILQAAPVAFDASTFEVWGALLNGGRLALHPEAIPTPRGLAEAIRRFGVTTMWLTAALFNTVVDEDPGYLEGLIELLTGGEALSVPHIRRALARLPRTQLINGYGPTETTTFAVCHRIPRALEARLGAIPIGSAIRDTHLYLLDADRNPVPEGAEGELYIGGRGVARGYLKRPELTAERFLDDPFHPGGLMYRTGDLVRTLPDGTIDFVGRADQQVKVRGFRIELGEIEQVLAELPGIKRCVVVARATPAGEKRLVAYVVAEGSAPTTTELRQKLGDTLPEYMVPAVFVWLPALPITANGKVDRAALPEVAQERPALNVEYVAPRSAVEVQLAGLWADLLGLGTVGVLDNVFDLGASSLLVVRAVGRLRERHGLELPVVKVFEFPTVAGMAAYFEGKQRAGALERAAGSVSRERRSRGVAIVGMAGRFPGAATVEELWRNLVGGKETVARFTDAELDPNIPAELVRDPRYVKARGVLEDIDLFDASFFGITPKEAALMDPQQRLILEVAWETLESAGHVPDSYPGTIGVFAGKYNDTYYSENVVTRPDLIAELGAFQVMVGNEKDYVATRVAHRLDLRGPALSVHTACSTSLVATVMALQSLEAGQCDLALAGGSSLTVPVKSGHVYQEGAMLSSDGSTRTFDAAASGTVFSDGVAMVALKRLEDALADGDTIYGVIRGGALTNDGGGKASFTAPSVDGQARVVAMAHAAAGVDPRDISYVETHGTATPLGDPIEVEALTQAFRLRTEDRGFCGLGSVKSNLGHLVIAAGATGLIKTALALTHKLIPATLHYRAPNPKLDFANSPFYVIDQLTPWPEGRGPRLAGVSSFGVGGTNAHVVVEEPPSIAAVPSARSSHLLVLSARSEAALDAAAEKLAAHLDQDSGQALADVAFTLQAGRKAFPFRRVVVGTSGADAAAALRAREPKRVVSRKAPAVPPEVVFMFPGQGSQYPGMGARLYAEHPTFRVHVEECLEALPPSLAENLHQLVFDPSEPDQADVLRQTAHAQPALFIVEYAVARLWQSWGLQPKALLGHSVGEFVAAALAGVMAPPEAALLVAERGQLMQDRPPGSMLSVRLPASDVEKRLAATLGTLGLAVENSPSSCVVAGPAEEVAAFQAALEAQQIACRPLVTSHAFHTPMMDGAVEPFLERLRAVKLARPQIPIVSTVTGTWMSAEEATLPEYWARQLRLPVRFSSAAATLLAERQRLLLEVGPRATLATLARQQIVHKDSQSCLASLSESGGDEERALLLAAGQLWLRGVPLDAAALHGPERRRRVPLPSYPFERKRFWIDPARPAPPVSVAQAVLVTPTVEVPAAPPMFIPPPPIAVAVPEPTREEPMPNATPSSSDRRARLVEQLCEVLEETTGLEISPSDGGAPFIELGLDSLFLTQLTSAVQKRFGVKVTFRELQEEYSSMDSLAARIESTLPPEAAPAPAPATVAPAVAAAPVAAAPMAYAVAAPMPASTATPGTVQWLVEQQLRLMAQQLALLGGAPAPAPMMTAPVAVATPPSPSPISTPSASAPGPSAPAPSHPEEEGGAMMKYDVKKAFGAIARIHVAKTDELTPLQKTRLDAFIRRYNARTKGSKKFTQDNRHQVADPRVVTGFRPLTKELVYPIVVDRSKGSKMWDIDGNEYVDVLSGFGPNMFGWQPDFVAKALKEQIDRGYEIGPQHPMQADVAKLVCEFTKFDRAAFCNTGSEAVMGCMRIARTVTGRSLIAIFTGAYHGIFDEVIVRGTKKLRSIPAAPGIMPSASQNVLVLDYGTPESLEILKNRADELAAIQVEPVQSRRPDFQPKEFLQELRLLTERSGSLYIFDEVVTGFRLAQGGAQEYFGIQADVAAYGKVIGGGIPIGVIAGKQRFMDALDGGWWQYGDASTPPVGVTYFAGTFVRHPLALTAAHAVLLHMKEKGPSLQRELNDRTTRFAAELNGFIAEVEAPLRVKSFASLWRATFEGDQPFGDLFFYMMRDRGVHIYDGFPCFFTTAHSEADYAAITRAFKESLLEMIDAGFVGGKRPAQQQPAVLDPNAPPAPGARLGRDQDGNPAWFVPHPANPKKYVRVGADGNGAAE